MNKGSSDLLTTKLDKTHTFLHSTYIPPCTAIPDRASTGPEQGFPCIVFQHRENPVFISWHCINGTIICSCLLSTVKLRAVDRTTNQFWNFLATPKIFLKSRAYCISNRKRPVFITGIPANKNRFFPVWKYYTGKTLF